MRIFSDYETNGAGKLPVDAADVRAFLIDKIAERC